MKISSTAGAKKADKENKKNGKKKAPARKTAAAKADAKSAAQTEATGPVVGDDDDAASRGYTDFSYGKFWEISRYLDPDLDPKDPDTIFSQDIHFGVYDIADPMPPEQQKLKNRIETTLSALKLIYNVETTDPKRQARNRASFDEAFDKLFALTSLGLGQEHSKTEIADAALTSLQAEIVDREGGRVKNEYLEKLGIPALLAALVFSLIFLAYQYIPQCAAHFSFCGDTKYDFLFPEELHKFRHIFLVLAGCMGGTWASFAIRKVALTFYDLAIIEQDRIAPYMRLIFTGVLTTILTLIVTTGLVDIVIGGFKASSLLTSGAVAVLVGAFAGLSEQALPAAIAQRAKGFLDAVNA